MDDSATSMTDTTMQQQQTTQQSESQTTTQSDSQTTQQSDSQTTQQSDSMTTQQSNDQTTQQSDSQTTQQSNGQTTQQSNDQTTQQSNGQTTQQSNGQTTQQSNGQTTQQSNGQTTQQSNGQTTQQSNGQTTQQSNGQTTQQSNVQTTQQSNGQTTQQSNGQTTQQSNGQTTQQSNGQTTQQSNDQTTQQSNGQTTQQSNDQTTQQSDSQTTQQSDSQTTQQSDSQTTQQSDSQTTQQMNAQTTTAMAQTTTTTTQSSVTLADPCVGVTCQNGGTCRAKPSIPTESECLCTADYEGDTCQYAVARFDTWGAWGSCSQTCRGATKTRSRSCTDVTNANRTGDCTGDSTEEILCSEITAECPLTSDPCVEDPNICFTDGVNHTCATNADGTFRCVCEVGFVSDSNNRYCINQDECSTTTNLCRDVNSGSFRTGVSGCTDNVGSYSCTCASGYTAASNTNNRDCNDVDECTANTDNCDSTDRATCTNTGGSFTCACNQGFTGDGTTGSCTENRLMSTTGHTEVSSSSDFSNYMFFDFAVPFGTTLLPSAYVTKSGLMLLTTVTEQTQSQGVRKSFPNPVDALDSSFQEKAAFAAWWGNMVFNTGTSSMYYKQYKSTVTADASVLTAISSEVAAQFGTPATGTAFSAMEMIVATWIRMGQAAVPSQMVTFQAILATDYINTYCKAIYGDRAMLWDIVVGSVPKYPVVVGYILSSGTKVDYPYSRLDMVASTASTNKPKLEQIDNVIVDNESPPPTIKGNSKGVMFFRITNHDNTFEHLGRKCKTWIDDDIQNSITQIAPLAEQRCPAELQQMTATFHVFDTVSGSDCYSLRSADNSLASDKRSLRCCYKNSALVTDHSLVNGKNTYRIHAENDTRQVMADTTYRYCCDASNEYLARADLCLAFLAVRPVCNANNFTANAAGGGLGDPHLTTLDRLSYTFNGHGEFVLLKTTSGTFEAQGRFLPLITDGVKTATYIGGIAAQQTSPNSDRVEIILNSARDGVDIYKNGNLQSLDLSSPVDLLEVTLTKTTVNSTDTYRMIYSNGITVGVRLENAIFSLVVEISSNFANSVQGLLGNFNGDQEDDYMSPNGTVLSGGSSATESEVYNYGLTWQNNETNTLFSYPGGGNWSNFIDAAFSPIFFDSDLTVMFPNATERTLAQDTCYQTGQTDPDPTQRRQCYFDFKVTGDATLAQGTSASQASLEQTQQSLANYPPEITNGNVTLEVIVGSSYSSLLTLVTQDRNGDSVTLTVNADAPSGVTINSNTKQLSWTSVPDITTGTLEITASDGNAQSIFIPKIELCNCQNGGTCDFSASSNDLFFIVPCICATGYVGTSCENDEDGCADGPCFTGVSCTDVPASQLASNPNPFICGSCPIGLEGNGQTCTDLDECQEVPPRCSQTCTNIAFGFECSCNAGYNLDADTVTCNDIDECQRNTDSCDSSSTMCVNTVGSYNCSCKTGYQPSSNPLQCEDIDECALNNNCDQICTDGIGLYTCSCRSGFTLQNDTISCEADTVCNATQRADCDSGNARSSCSVLNGEVQCICPQGFTLSLTNLCENIDECTAGTDVCVSSSSDCIDFDGGYNCSCKTGYNQVDTLTCQDIDECTTNTHNCASPAVCQNTMGGYVCTCPSGYTLASSGLACDNIDECSQSTLNLCDKQNGNCLDTTPGYTCSCQSGYTGDGFSCTDLNECAQSNRGGCSQQCRNSIGTFTCSCNEGYTLNNDGSTCDNVNECSDDLLNECLDSSTYCSDTAGSYDCSCPANFTLKGDGRTCESDFKCAAGHNCSHTCGKINNVDTCQCPTGYQVGSDGKTCEDINECSNSTLNNCDQANKVTCYNLAGSFRCDCVNSSYQAVSSTMCSDIDECLDPNNGCPANSQCVNSDPGFSCTCLSGYVSVSGNCQDDDECVKGTHACNVTIATCSNTDGGYTCSCRAGYSGNGITCTDVDECVDGTHTCDRRAGVGVCTNNVGSFTCSCASGYTLASNGLTCNDVDECRDGTDNCEFGCTNNDGGFTCTCPTGYRLQADQRTCVVEVACASGHGCSFECANINGQDTCTCQDGYSVSTSDNTLCEDINECQASPGPCDQNFGSCTNTQGSYNCSCTQDYILGPSDSCADRNGNWGVWGAWGTCSQTCGTGSQSRTRACDNPSKEGNGADCLGISSETQDCNTNFTSIATSFQQTVATEINAYCNANTSAVQQCCSNSNTNYSPNPSTPLVFTTSDKISVGDSYPVVINGDLYVMIVVKANQNNALCTAAAASTSSRRRKRAITLTSFELAIPQTVLQSILNDVSV
ncbi:hypothetical protein FSP39_020372 [Pinctada imbricata]|uniref:Uncharacterized protein n=1 Tax=Pinctada imbricata TaxID=66713 RepID=A0AA88YF09_PINIB|nr:hypothetical protein FSP39_020372 [Pinctada imbricata]